MERFKSDAVSSVVNTSSFLWESLGSSRSRLTPKQHRIVLFFLSDNVCRGMAAQCYSPGINQQHRALTCECNRLLSLPADLAYERWLNLVERCSEALFLYQNIDEKHIYELSSNRANFKENSSMRAIAPILRARASEHSSKICEKIEQRPNFAST